MSAPSKVIELVERFNDNLDSYKRGNYNETKLRIEYINPFFEELGWDVQNKQGYAEAYKDVVHEDAIKIAGATKAPDYCFRIGGTRKFFLEAKKPSVYIKEAIHPAYQLRRYAWSAKLHLSILTDFEEFAIYDCRIKPIKNDKPSNARIQYMTFKDYPDRWEEIASIFSREAILKGSFDKYSESTKRKRGTAEVDDAFLSEIESWRSLLAKNFALRNPRLSNRQLNEIVQKTVDRIIFLRICEDRGIEDYGQLMSLQNGTNTYSRLCKIYLHADNKYNSGLFYFSFEKGRQEPDRLSLELNLDDKVLKDIFKRLYYPDSPYEFSVLPADILGQIYEQFLGKVIRLTSGHKAIVEEKPEVRKAGGVYYTPTYIVDYIVKNTVGKLLEGKTPKQAAKLKILDPACGSGSFLLGAYQYLLGWYLKQYIDNNPEKHSKGKSPKICQTQKGEWKLTTAEKKRILLNNIYGVDIDTQAVEVTKLSLLLRVLESETEQSLRRQLKLFHERALPDLGNNIKCGNSLIGSDYYVGKQATLFDEEEMYKVNAFDWEKEFAEIMKSGGFDVVIGNPPWISLTGKFGAGIYPKSEIDYLIKRFSGNTYMPNMYEYFVAQGLRLLANSGYFGYIVPDRLGFNSQFIELRKEILNKTNIISLIYKAPFPNITADTLIYVIQRKSKHTKSYAEIGEYGKELLLIPQREFEKDSNYAFQYYDNIDIMNMIKKTKNSKNLVCLSSLCDTTSGFGGKSELITITKERPSQIGTIKGNSIGRYVLKKIYWFDFKKQNITGRTTDKEKLGAIPKILLRKTGDRILAAFDSSGIFPEQSLYFLYNNQSNLNFKYFLGILNSSFVTFYYRNELITNKQSIAQLKKVHLDLIPIRTIDFSNSKDKSHHDKMVKLVDGMLELNKQLAKKKSSHNKTVLQRQIEATDWQIDELVYELYGLTEKEIKIVEEG